MRRAVSVIVVIGVIFLVIGFGFFFAGMMQLDWDYTKFNSNETTVKNETFELDKIDSIKVDVSTASVKILHSYDDIIKVEYFIVNNKNGDIVRQVIPTIENGVLICEESSDVPFSLFDFENDDQLVIVIPQSKSIPLDIKTSTGNIEIGQYNSDVIVMTDVNITTSTGNVIIYAAFSCNKMTIEASTGNLIVNGNLFCFDNLNFKANTGNFRLDGQVKAKNIFVELSTGNVNCIETIDFDNLTIKTSTGDVNLKMKYTKDNYSYNYTTSTGDSNMASFVNGDKIISVRTSTGDINLYFKEE